MSRTRTLTMAGVMNIISCGLGIIASLFSLMVLFYPPPGWGPICLILFPVFGMMAILALVGGIYALQKKKWGLALVGSIAALSPVVITGVIAIVLIIISKKDFQVQ